MGQKKDQQIMYEFSLVQEKVHKKFLGQTWSGKV